MEILLLVAAWYAAGLFGSFLIFYFGWVRDGLDVSVGDIVVGFVTAAFGPINLVVGVVFFAMWLFGGLVDTDRVVFRARSK